MTDKIPLIRRGKLVGFVTASFFGAEITRPSLWQKLEIGEII